ncbi:MAG: hypothetical protein JSW13_05995 [Candidatus Aerophobus sp.]|nr:MAG: hypothetical protein JSW13_05995 [Candidatus Aerophobus sp.]
MSFIIKKVFIIIGIIALGILITFGVGKIRFRSMERALTTEIKILQETNLELQTKNGNLIEQIRTLKAQFEARTQEYERRISQLEEEVQRDKTANKNTEALRTEVRSLQKTNQNLQAKNADLTEQIKALKAELETKIRIIPNE